jgi:predicted ATPase/class 3 adenylate cyclase
MADCDLPTGTVTFLFSDIEGSTRLLARLGDEYTSVLTDHYQLLRSAIDGHRGRIVDTSGDGVFAVFADAKSAVLGALDAQRVLTAHKWPHDVEVSVRMGLHAGTAHLVDCNYIGMDVHRTARISAVAHGGQTVISDAVRALVETELPADTGVRDLGRHALKDIEVPEHLFQLVAPDLRHEFPPLNSLSRPHTNLPRSTTSFIGRDAELASVEDLVERSQLVTLVGVGGTGKTRLLLELATRIQHQYRDGAWLVELASIRDGELIASEAVRTIGAQEQRGQTATETLIEFLRAKEMLLALDNCEHVIEPAATLAQRIVVACPGVKIAATSREPLGVDGEMVASVPSLSMPRLVDVGGEELDTAGEAAKSDAVRLFIERAGAVLPGFSLTQANAPAIAEITRRLDGIPLAIELAAAKVVVLSVEEIDQRLGDRFRLLAGGRRTAVPRQQTLQATIDWSWDLLTMEDRRLLRRLSVFAGGWSLDEAAIVAGDDASLISTPIPTPAAATALDGLSRLVDRSLVVVDHGPTTRYRLLETIRQYARDRLIASGETETVGTRHLNLYARLVADAESGVHGPDMAEWLQRLDREADNIRAALEWAFESQPERAVAMSISLVEYWRSRSVGREELDTLTRAVGVARELARSSTAAPASNTVMLARVLAAASFAQSTFGEAPEGRRWAEEAVELARAAADGTALSEALTSLLLAKVFSADMTSVPALADELSALSEQLEDWTKLSYVLTTQAQIALEHDVAEAEAVLVRSANAARRSRNPAAMAFAAMARANVLSRAGRFAEAQPSFLEAVDRYRAIGDRRFEVIVQSGLAHALRRDGQVEAAESEYRQTLHGWLHFGNRGAVANQLESIGMLAVARNDPLRAARLFGAAEALRHESHAPMTSVEREEYDSALVDLNRQLDRSALDAAWAAGGDLTLNEAVAVALSSPAPADLPA